MTGFPGGSPARHRSYPKSTNALMGLDVYDVQDRIGFVITHEAVPKGPLDEMIGPPRGQAALGDAPLQDDVDPLVVDGEGRDSPDARTPVGWDRATRLP